MHTEFRGSQCIKVQFINGREHPETKEIPAPTELRIRQEVLPPAGGAGDPMPLPSAEYNIHGRYALPSYGAPAICPYCKQEAEEVERKLLRLLPGGWA